MNGEFARAAMLVTRRSSVFYGLVLSSLLIYLIYLLAIKSLPIPSTWLWWAELAGGMAVALTEFALLLAVRVRARQDGWKAKTVRLVDLVLKGFWPLMALSLAVRVCVAAAG